MAPACAGCGAIFCIARCPGLWNCVRDYSGAGQEINCPKPFTTACHMADVRFYSKSWPCGAEVKEGCQLVDKLGGHRLFGLRRTGWDLSKWMKLRAWTALV